MIWHIVRKDLRLLWPLACAVALVNLGNAALLIIGGPFARGSQSFEGAAFGWISNGVLPAVGIVGLILLIVSVVHQDPLPGTTQDWLTRPIPRGKLWTAKLVFVLLAGLAPILLADVVMGMAEHLRLAQVLAASVSRCVVLFCLVCVPSALLALVTTKLTEVLVAVIGLIVALIVAMIAAITVRFQLQSPVMVSGYAWVGEWVLIAASLVSLAIVLPLQLHWRSTPRVRWILLVVACLVPLVVFMPWGMALWAAQIFGESRHSEFKVEPDNSRQLIYRSEESTVQSPLAKSVWLTVPLTLRDMGENNYVYVDQSAIRLVAANGAEIYRATSEEAGGLRTGGFLLGPFARGRSRPELTLRLPKEAFAAGRTSHATMEVELNLTEFHRTSEMPFDALVREPPDNRTRCSVIQTGPAGREGLSCVSTRAIGECYQIRDVQQDRESGRMHMGQCNGATYTPWPLPLWRDPYYTAWYFDAAQLIARARRQTEVEDSIPRELMLDTYMPAAHDERAISFSVDVAIEKSQTGPARTVDGNGSAARFASPSGAVTDRKGNLFVVDWVDSVVRKMTPSGDVSTVAGSPRQVGSADGPGGEARFNQPRGISVDASDNLLIADTGNGLIRKMTPSGVVTTLSTSATAANTAPKPLRFANPVAVVPAGDGSLYVIEAGDLGTGRHAAGVKRITADGVVGIIAGPIGEEEETPSVGSVMIDGPY